MCSPSRTCLTRDAATGLLPVTKRARGGLSPAQNANGLPVPDSGSQPDGKSPCQFPLSAARLRDAPVTLPPGTPTLTCEPASPSWGCRTDDHTAEARARHFWVSVMKDTGASFLFLAIALPWITGSGGPWAAQGRGSRGEELRTLVKSQGGAGHHVAESQEAPGFGGRRPRQRAWAFLPQHGAQVHVPHQVTAAQEGFRAHSAGPGNQFLQLLRVGTMG